MTDLLGPPWPYPRCPQERSIHVLLTAVKSCASNTSIGDHSQTTGLASRIPWNAPVAGAGLDGSAPTLAPGGRHERWAQVRRLRHAHHGAARSLPEVPGPRVQEPCDSS